MDGAFIHNGYFYLTCNGCDCLIPHNEKAKENYNKNFGYCDECFEGMEKR